MTQKTFYTHLDDQNFDTIKALNTQYHFKSFIKTIINDKSLFTEKRFPNKQIITHTVDNNSEILASTNILDINEKITIKSATSLNADFSVLKHKNINSLKIKIPLVIRNISANIISKYIFADKPNTNLVDINPKIKNEKMFCGESIGIVVTPKAGGFGIYSNKYTTFGFLSKSEYINSLNCSYARLNLSNSTFNNLKTLHSKRVPFKVSIKLGFQKVNLKENSEIKKEPILNITPITGVKNVLPKTKSFAVEKTQKQKDIDYCETAYIKVVEDTIKKYNSTSKKLKDHFYLHPLMVNEGAKSDLAHNCLNLKNISTKSHRNKITLKKDKKK